MRLCNILFASVLSLCRAGPNDSQDQLVATLTNVKFEDQALHSPVTRVEGELPGWLSGSLIRHACGAFGETEHPAEAFLNRVTHLFDCIEMGQAYHFHEGEVTFSSQFYDTNAVDIWLSYGENMNQSSVWWGTVYADRNLTALARESENMYKPGKHSAIPAVAWWQIGDKVVATSEYPRGVIVDPHNVKALDDYPFSNNNDWIPDGYQPLTSPSHEAVGEDGIIYSTAAFTKTDTDDDGMEIMKNKRLVFKVDPETQRREVIAEIDYPDALLSLCLDNPGQRYPIPEARLGHMHSLQTTERFIIVAENAYLHDPCSEVNFDPSLANYPMSFSYESDSKSRIHIINKNGDVEALIEVPPFFITHVLGSYEDNNSNMIHFDVLQYADAGVYEDVCNIERIANGQEIPEDYTQVTRYSINMDDWTDYEIKNLVTDPDINQYFEFSNINPAYYTKPYKFAYLTHNAFILQGSVVKLNVNTGSIIKKELPDGLFPTEPIFVADPNGTEEDDGVILMSGMDGGNEKGFIMVYNASNMDVLYQGMSPKKTLIGLHSKFYPFHIGCSESDCTPA